MADNQWQWPSQEPRSGPPAGYPVPPTAGYPVPPPPAGYPVPPPGGTPPPASHPGQQGGYQVRMTPAMRASSADRERAIDVLKAGFAEGRLTRDEYDERMGRAYAARTYGELNALICDLPAGAMPLPPGERTGPVRAYQPSANTNTLAIAAMVLGAAEVFTFGLTAIPAVLCGHLAKRQIRQTGQSGDGLATGGLVLGYLAIIFWAFLALRIATNGGP